ncbi:MAG: chorismate synthase [Candidatus Melainabacteria bacterium]|nr:chorismate synthase [Candidatus Melainabacteria bacterium]
MPALRLITGGESHGKAIVSILEGLPAGLSVDIDIVNNELRARQGGYGRSGRQRIESDQIEILGGLRHGITTGAPLAMLIENRDSANWTHIMSSTGPDMNDPAVLAALEAKKIVRFRPGHADYAGVLKYGHKDVRDVLERASARETAARVAAGAFAQVLLQALGITAVSHVVAIGAVSSKLRGQEVAKLPLPELEQRARQSEVFCADLAASAAMKEAIKAALMSGDSLGGQVEVLADNLPVGLGSFSQWDRRLDGQLAQALMSIQAMKAVEIGEGISDSQQPGSNVHDPIYPSDRESSNLPVRRESNHAGGVEGGMTNGERLIVRAYMKPIPTLKAGLASVTYPEFEACQAHYERSDVCAVPAASVVAKAMVCLTLANSVIDKFASDSMRELSASLKQYREYCQNLNS